MQRIHLCLITSVGWLLLAGGCQRAANTAAAQTSSAPAPAAVATVIVGPPERKSLTLSTSQPGQIDAFEQTPLFSKVAGYVDEVCVDIGDKVRKGQALIKLSVPEMQDDLAQQEALTAQAQAELKQAEASVDGASAAVKSAEARMAQAQAGIVRTEGEYARWKAEYERIKQLAAERAVTEKLADETLNQLRAAEGSRAEAKAAVQSTQALLDEARVGVRKAEADVGAAQARLGVAQANLARTKTLLKYTTITAPYDAVVTRRLVDTGHYVSPPGSSQAQPLMVVSHSDMVRVFVDVPELDAEWVHDGDPAEVRVQALDNQSFSAKVTRTGWSLDSTNRTLRTEIDIPNADGALRPGMYATAIITLEKRPDVLTLPATAIVRDGADTYCLEVLEGKVSRRKVELGLRVGNDIEVRSGLRPDQVVVISPASALSVGQAVSATAAPKK